ncbi:MAG: rhamnogalacturonan acetylesterase, partial [Duncaniella sp.]|nr:rhamnogalacturonan acetylesterase [Duncaniella sp.]
RFGKEKVKAQVFYLDRIHTSEYGARINAASAAEGIRAYPGLELAQYLLPSVADTVPGITNNADGPTVYVVGRDESGPTPRAFIESGRWDRVYNSLRPGDKVCICFTEACNTDRESDEDSFMLPGSGEESKVYKMSRSGRYRVVYTYGWYIRKIMQDCVEKGAVPELR